MGECPTLASAVLYAGQILWTGRVSRRERVVQLAVVQSAVVSVIMGLFALPGGVHVPARVTWWLALLYLAIACGALTLVLQIWAQSHIDPVRAAVIMCSEPLWTTVFAVAFAHEHLGAALIFGGSMTLAAMLVVVVPGVRCPGRDPAGAVGPGAPDRGRREPRSGAVTCQGLPRCSSAGCPSCVHPAADQLVSPLLQQLLVDHQPLGRARRHGRSRSSPSSPPTAHRPAPPARRCPRGRCRSCRRGGRRWARPPR